jgi:phage tail sheath protein FI
MPEYLAPGVYVEETSFRAKSIEGVGTSTTGFVGATRYGPTEGEPELMTSFGQFERIYGGLDPLMYSDVPMTNYLAHAVRAFFDNGGSRLYVARAFSPTGSETAIARAAIPAPVPEIAAVDTMALGASSRVLQSLGAGLAALAQSQAAAVFVLQFAVRQTLSALVSEPAPELDYGYADEEDDIGEQINDWITGLDLVLVPEAPELLEAFTNTWRAVIDAADAQLQVANTALASAEAAQAAVGGAYATGVSNGSNLNLTGLTSNLTVLNTNGLAANTAATGAETAVIALMVPQQAVATSLPLVTNATTAQTAMTNATALTTAAIAVTTASSSSVADITTAAQAARVETRLAITAADAEWVARFPGGAGNMTVVVSGRLGANVLTGTATEPTVRQVRDGDLVVVQRGGSATVHGVIRREGAWIFAPPTGSELPLNMLDPTVGDRVYPLLLTVETELPGRFSQPLVWDTLTVSATPTRQRDSIITVFAETISNRLQALETPIVLSLTSDLSAAQIAESLLNLSDWTDLLNQQQLVQAQSYTLTGGSDGQIPAPEAYLGAEDGVTGVKSGLLSLEDPEEISIVAAPGYSQSWDSRRPEILTISQHLINHCERMRYRVAVLDSPNNQSLSGVREYRALIDTTRAAMYYPWVRILDPVSDQELDVPPSGFMAGIYARSDVEIGVHKAPANEVVRGAIGLEILINKGQQDVLNPLGINCIRFFEGRGIRVWGARTVSSDPEWKYLNIRRYFVYLEASIDRATQWAVFEPNGDRLWANVRRAVESFLETEWRDGRLAGAKVEEAFFVRCDRSTMTQNDLDNGRMICLIGVSPLYPAEFVIFRIGQWTADRRA